MIEQTNSHWLKLEWAVTDFIVECPPLLLRPIAPSDFATLCNLYTNAQIQQFIAPALTLAAATQRCAAMQAANAKPSADKYYLTIAEKVTQSVIGIFAVFHLNASTASCEIGLMLVKTAQGRGIARHALVAMLQHLQQHFGIAKIHSLIHQQNLPTIRLARQCHMQLIKCEGDFLHYVLAEPIAAWRMSDSLCLN